MEALIIQNSDDTPAVNFDPVKGIFELSGRSLPENAIQFYTPLLEWMNTYIQSPSSASTFNFNFEYLSTSSTKQVMKLILMADKLSKSSKVTVNWQYDKGDEDMMQTGERLQKLTSLQFNFRES